MTTFTWKVRDNDGYSGESLYVGDFERICIARYDRLCYNNPSGQFCMHVTLPSIADSKATFYGDDREALKRQAEELCRLWFRMAGVVG